MMLALNHAGRVIGGEESTCTAIRTKGAMLMHFRYNQHFRFSVCLISKEVTFNRIGGLYIEELGGIQVF